VDQQEDLGRKLKARGQEQRSQKRREHNEKSRAGKTKLERRPKGDLPSERQTFYSPCDEKWGGRKNKKEQKKKSQKGPNLNMPPERVSVNEGGEVEGS